MSEVYRTRGQAKYDYAPAAAFGDLVTVADRVYSFAPGNAVNGPIVGGIATCAREFNPAEDFVLPSGSAIMTALFFVALAARGVDRVRVLMWATADGMYSASYVDMRALIGGATHV